MDLKLLAIAMIGTVASLSASQTVTLSVTDNSYSGSATPAVTPTSLMYGTGDPGAQGNIGREQLFASSSAIAMTPSPLAASFSYTFNNRHAWNISVTGVSGSPRACGVIFTEKATFGDQASAAWENKRPLTQSASAIANLASGNFGGRYTATAARPTYSDTQGPAPYVGIATTTTSLLICVKQQDGSYQRRKWINSLPKLNGSGSASVPFDQNTNPAATGSAQTGWIVTYISAKVTVFP